MLRHNLRSQSIPDCKVLIFAPHFRTRKDRSAFFEIGGRNARFERKELMGFGMSHLAGQVKFCGKYVFALEER